MKTSLSPNDKVRKNSIIRVRIHPKIIKISGICNRCRISHNGRSIGIRTRGLLDPNQARYQTSPYPEIQYIIPIFYRSVNQNIGFYLSVIPDFSSPGGNSTKHRPESMRHPAAAVPPETLQTENLPEWLPPQAHTVWKQIQRKAKNTSDTS